MSALSDSFKPVLQDYLSHGLGEGSYIKFKDWLTQLNGGVELSLTNSPRRTDRPETLIRKALAVAATIIHVD